MRVVAAIAFVSVIIGGIAPADAEMPAPTGVRTIVVSLDGTGDFTSIQEAVDSAKKGDTVFLKPGAYPQDLTIHSKEGIKLVGAGVDQVTLLGHRDRVGVLHVGKWPYGATDIEITGLTVNDHGGHAVGIFNGKRVTLRHLRVKGMLFGQQVQDVRIENCLIGGSETTGVQFADTQAVLIGNVIHDNDHGVNVAGKSEVRLERNVITRNLYEAVVIGDGGKAALISNTLVKNGRGAAFLGSSRNEVSGNIVSLNTIGFLIAPSSRTTLSFNGVFNEGGNYLKPGSPPLQAPELKPESDIAADPRFVDAEHDDFRLRHDTAFLNKGPFSYLGAKPPLPAPSSPHQ
jgi:parallel beta-helix repeat protein